MNPKQIEEFFHLTSVQKQLLAASERAPNVSDTLVQYHYLLEGHLDVSAFKRAWQKVTDRQSTLRLTFVSGDLKEPVQVVNRNVMVDFEEHDWREIPKLEQQLRLQEFLPADRQHGFVLKHAPLWRVTLIRVAETTYHLCWTYHQFLLDAFSVTMLLTEVLAYYEAIRRAQNLFVPHSPSLRKYVDWLKKQDTKSAEIFWREQREFLLSGNAKKIHLGPLDCTLPEEIFAPLSQYASALQIEPETILIGAWGLFVQRRTEQDTVVLGLNVRGRPAELTSAERAAGHFSHTLPLVMQFPAHGTIQEWLQQLQAQCTALRQYEHFSWAQIQTWCELPHDQALGDIEIIFASEEKYNADQTNLQVRKLSVSAPLNFPTTITIRRAQPGGSSSTSPLTEWFQLLEQIISDPQKSVADFYLQKEEAVPKPVITKYEVSASEAEPGDEKGWVSWLKEAPSVNDLLTERAHQTPDDVALQIGDEALSYQELMTRANQLARYLRRLGVAPQIPVALCVDTSLEMMIGVIGILKAGGAYLPLAPTQATKDLRQIIYASTATVILTEARYASQLAEALSLKTQRAASGSPHSTSHSSPYISATHFVLSLDQHWTEIAKESPDYFACEVSDEHPACILYNLEDLNNRQVITQAKLALALDSTPAWFQLDEQNPWNLFVTPRAPSKVVAKVEAKAEVETKAETKIAALSLASALTPVAAPEALALTPVAATPAPAPESFLSTPEPLENMLEEVTLPPLSENSALDVDLLFADDDWAMDEIPAAEPALAPALSGDENPAAEIKTAAQTNVPAILAEDFATEAPTLAPIQQWFLAHHLLEPQHWNIAKLVEIKEKLEAGTLQKALQFLQASHNVLRLRFTQTLTDWQTQEMAPDESVPFEYIDLSTKWAKSQRKHIEDTAAQLQTSLHLSNGPLWRVVYFDLGAAPSDRLLLLFHHLIGDEKSLQIFLRDLHMVYQQIKSGTEPHLPQPIASYQEWVEQLQTVRKNLDVVNELRYWQKLNIASTLPVDNPAGQNTYGTTDRVFVSLSPKETETLLAACAENPAADLNEIVLTALVLAVTRWAGESAVLIELERSARQHPLVNLDVSHSLGWFTCQFPVLFALGKVSDVNEAWQFVRTHLRTIPQQGLSYGLLRYDSDELIRQALSDLPAPPVQFKWLALAEQQSGWAHSNEALGIEHHPHNARQAKISVTGLMNLGMLEFQWSYARQQFEQKNIGLLVNGFIAELRQLIEHAIPTGFEISDL